MTIKSSIDQHVWNNISGRTADPDYVTYQFEERRLQLTVSDLNNDNFTYRGNLVHVKGHLTTESTTKGLAVMKLKIKENILGY